MLTRFQPWMHKMPLPQQFNKYTVTEHQFQQSIAGYEARIQEIMIATAVAPISDVTSWKPDVTAATVTADWLKSIAKEVQRISHRNQALLLLLQRAGDRLYYNKDEPDSFLGWAGNAYHPYWSDKPGRESTKDLIDILSDGMFHYSSNLSIQIKRYYKPHHYHKSKQHG